MAKSIEFIKLMRQGLPIVLILCYLLFSDRFVYVSKTYLGKMIAVFIICLYSLQDVTHGLLICLLIILFYHEQVEGFLSKSTQEYANHIPKASQKFSSTSTFENHLEKDFTSVNFAYPTKVKPIKKENETLFRKEKCLNSKVVHKNQNMKNQMITHVYPELQFSGDQCNPCDPTCHFTIEKRQETEKSLEPMNSHTSVLEDIAGMFGMTKSEPFVVKNIITSEYS
uniref:Uncharacterized protein n=1 Tax=viral metagenome TaxID=1070528 RepID=A0A6C0CMC7_9ZZZZ